MRRDLVIGAAVPVLALGSAAALLLTPLTDPDLSSHPNASASSADATARIDAVMAAEADLELQPGGGSIALLTGHRTDTAVVIFHGLTAIPEQFRLIGEAYLAQGYNVWIPRLPSHGLANKMTDALSGLTAAAMRDFADRSIDIGAGLGTKLIVVGLSGGGSLGLWAGVERPEVSRTVLISPLLLPVGYQAWQMRALVRALRALPTDIYAWHDGVVKDTDTRAWGYPRDSYKAVSAFLSLTHWADAKASRTLYPIASPVVLVRNDADQVVDPAYAETFVNRMVAPENLTVIGIPASLGLSHDFVGFQKTNPSYAHLAEGYRYLALALGIPIPDPTPSASGS